MATISFTVDDTIAVRLLNDLAQALGYTGQGPSGAETKTAFVRRMTIQWWIQNAAQTEAQNAAQAASQTASTNFQSQVTPLVS